jgi:hypothetical protein
MYTMPINYVDKYGRFHIKPVTEANPLPTNNAYLYTFYASMVGIKFNITGDVVSNMLDIRSKPLSRHPNDNTPPISHDEYVGAAGMQSDGQVARFICEYGENNHWQISDLPGFKPTPFRHLVINDVLAAYEELANDPEDPRHAVIKYPALLPIAFWHRPEQQYFYYRCAGRSPGIIRTLYFILATLVSICSRKKTSPMLGFKFLKFKELGPTFIEKALGALFTKYGKWKETCLDYFPQGHPILTKVVML